VAGSNGYEPATPDDLAETVNLVQGEGRKILARELTCAMPPDSSG
jgi:hypothetical protein